ncbi:MAG: xylulokinase [Lachnospiraceae bacterium]|jgi:xylulokinase|nr:xylulokinase [Lachnospiraceae bacterium]
MKRLYLGIDLGTSAMKIVLMDEQKQVLAQTTEEYQLSSPQAGWSEIDQELWFERMVQGIRKVLEGRDASGLRSIGLTGQMHTLLVLDGVGRCIRPALMWNDLRTKDLIVELKENMRSFEDGEYFSRIISTGSPAANLYWMKKYEPENFSRIEKFLIGADYLVYRLTGCYGTDYCEASTSCLYEIRNRRWSAQMREFLGLKESAYPDVHESAHVSGTVTPEMAELLGISTEVTVLTGTGDNPAMAISTGCLGKGYPVISLGTSGVLVIPVEPDRDNPYGKKILFSFDNQKYYNLVQGVVQSNGSTMEWWLRKVLKKKDFSYIDKGIDLERAKRNSVIFYPHLAGEKTLYADPALRGSFFGISADSEQEDLTYSVLEGLCFGFRELSEKMELPLAHYGSVKVVGGGSKSSVWLQIMANVLNLPIERMDGMIGAAYGMALLTAHRDGKATDYTRIVEKTIHVEECFQPDPEMAAICNKKYQIYKRIYTGMKYITGTTS